MNGGSDKADWEGAFRVPLVLRWPGHISAGVVSNEIIQHHDWLPTFLAAAGEPDIVERLLHGHQAAGKTFRVHIDGYNLLPYLTGQETKGPRQGFIYFDDDGNLVAMRFNNWKVVFMEQRRQGTDPFERADITSNTYWDWFISRGYMVIAAQRIVSQFLETFRDFPPRQKPGSFTIDQALAKMAEAGGSRHR